MTKEEAIARIKNHKIVHKMNEPRAIYISEALDMAIKALDSKPCEDAISRQAVLDLVNSDWKYEGLESDIENLPSVKPQEKTGHWNCGDDMFEYAICSSCKHETGEAWEYAKRNFKFCPNCGVKMESEGLDEG